MRLAARKIHALCRRRGTTLTAVLREAAVSRNAYYALARKESLVPHSVTKLAAALGVAEREIVEGKADPARHLRDLAAKARRLVARHPDAEFENVWHTLLLLEEPPVDRLRRALIRGRVRSVRH